MNFPKVRRKWSKKKAVLFITSKTAAHKYNKGDIPFVQQK